MSSSSDSRRRGEKRKHLDNQSQDMSHMTDTPDTSYAHQSPSPRSKIKTDYDFWNTSPLKSNSPLQTGPLSISNIVVKSYDHQPIRFRVTHKFAMKSTAVGSVFNFHGIDDSGEIGFVAFRNDAIRFYETVKINGVYKLTNFKAKLANQVFLAGPAHKCEVHLESYSVLETPINQDGLPPIPFNFTPLNTIARLSDKTSVDILGIVVKDWNLDFTSGSFYKRDLSITDYTKSNVIVTLWRAAAENFNVELFSSAAIRNGVVSDYLVNNSVNCNTNTLVWFNAEIPEATKLREWFEVEHASVQG